MKTHPWLLMIVVVTIGLPARSADVHTMTRVERYALDFLKKHSTDDQLEAELKELGLASGKRHDEVVATVKAMRGALATGAVTESKAFWDEVGDLLRSAPVATERTPTSGDSSTKATIDQAAIELWKKGRAALAALPPAQRDVYLRYNLRDAEDATKQDIPTFAALAQSSAPAIADLEASDTPDQKANRLFVRLGYEKAAAAAAAAGSTLSSEQTTAVGNYGVAVADTPPAQDADTLLRKRGVAITTGMGVVLGRGQAGDNGVGTVLARWNWLQRHATARWNQKIGANNPDGDTLVNYFGQIEYSLPGFGRNPRATPYVRTVENKSWFEDILLDPSFLGPFFGSTVVGDRMPVPGGAATDKERPYLVGLGVGFGFYREAAPLVYLDWGWTVSPSKGFKSSANYIGFSFDGIVLEKILQGIRGRPTPVSP